MKTKVFLSWGGTTSRAIAKETKRWMESVIQAVEPFYSDRDIDSGSYFPSELIKPLEATNIGVICLTKECLDNKWVHFEAGNLFKGNTESRVHTLLFGLDSSQVESPLSFFQHKKFQKQQFKEFMEVVNKATGELQLDTARFEEYFEREWPAYEKKINAILATEESASTKKERRPLEDMVEEILELVRSNQRGLFSRSSPDSEIIRHDLLSKAFDYLKVLHQNIPPDSSDQFIEALNGLKDALGDANIEIYGRLAEHVLTNPGTYTPSDETQHKLNLLVSHFENIRKARSKGSGDS